MSKDPLPIHERLTVIFRTVFASDTLSISDATTASDIEGWDSLAQINLVVAAEETFSVRFSVPEIRGLKNVGEFKALIGSKLASPNA